MPNLFRHPTGQSRLHGQHAVYLSGGMLIRQLMDSMVKDAAKLVC